jgi:hypothetical protein
VPLDGDSPEKNWNCVFSELERLNEKLEKLGIGELI